MTRPSWSARSTTARLARMRSRARAPRVTRPPSVPPAAREARTSSVSVNGWSPNTITRIPPRSREPLPAEELRRVFRETPRVRHPNRRHGQGSEERRAIRRRHETRIAHHEDPPVAGAPDQPPDTLAEPQHRLRHGVGAERLQTLFPQPLSARLDARVVRH